MPSGKDDHNDLDMDMNVDAGGVGDVIDVVMDEPLSASPLGGAEKYDHDGSDDDADEVFDGEDVPKPRKKSGGMKKMVAPLVVLLAAACAGGYIVMNPSILSGPPVAQVGEPVAITPPAADTAMMPPPEVSLEVAATDVPPQPIANLNEAPPAPEVPIADPTAIVAEVPPVDPSAVPVADATAAEPAAQEDSVQAVLGSDVAVSSEAVSLQGPAADAAAPAEPTFVPAPPADALAMPVVAANEAASVDAAAPPVMNVQEVNGVPAPEMPPSTAAAASPAEPAAASGRSEVMAAPETAVPESNIYYDSLAQVPTGAMATTVGPRELNPVLEPASKMVIVSKDKNSSSPEALLVSANRALKLKRYDSALEMFDQLYAKNKRDERILMGRAVAQQNMGLSESAVQSYEEVLALKPGHTEAMMNMLGLVRAQYPEVALRRLMELYAKNPNNGGVAAQIGITNAGLGHYEDAMRYLGIASTLEPANAQHLFNMAVAADRNGKRTQAIGLYEKALEVDVMHGASRSVPRESIYDRLSVLRRS